MKFRYEEPIKIRLLCFVKLKLADFEELLNKTSANNIFLFYDKHYFFLLFFASEVITFLFVDIHMHQIENILSSYTPVMFDVQCTVCDITTSNTAASPPGSIPPEQ